jgi:hypothetical protein
MITVMQRMNIFIQEKTTFPLLRSGRRIGWLKTAKAITRQHSQMRTRINPENDTATITSIYQLYDFILPENTTREERSTH